MSGRERWHVAKPCTSCPFRREGGVPLYRERWAEILRAVTPPDARGGPFPCHKTVDHDERNYATERQCAGALIYMYKVGASSNIARIMERLGGIDPDLATGDHPDICGSKRELLALAIDVKPARRRRSR